MRKYIPCQFEAALPLLSFCFQIASCPKYLNRNCTGRSSPRLRRPPLIQDLIQVFTKLLAEKKMKFIFQGFIFGHPSDNTIIVFSKQDHSLSVQ